MMKRKSACIIIGSFSIAIGIVLTAVSVAFGGLPASGSAAEIREAFSERFGWPRHTNRTAVLDEYAITNEEVITEDLASTEYGYLEPMNWSGSQSDLPNLELQSLVVDLDHSSVEIVQGNAFRIETDVDSNIQCYLEGNELHITEEGSWIEFSPKKGLKNNSSKVKITLLPNPLRYLDISTGAGNINISDLDTEELNIDAGAGAVKANNLFAATSYFELGAGNVSIQNFVGRENTDISSGVGSVKLEGELLNSATIEGGVGTIDLNLRGNVNDYQIDAESGMGTVKVNGEKVSSLFEDAYQTNSGNNSLYIEGGVGSVDIRFTER